MKDILLIFIVLLLLLIIISTIGGSVKRRAPSSSVHPQRYTMFPSSAGYEGYADSGSLWNRVSGLKKEEAKTEQQRDNFAGEEEEEEPFEENDEGIEPFSNSGYASF